jgi:hypothetical protein
VRSYPLYEAAQRACAARQYARAAELLQELSRTPGLSPEDLAFCRSQIQICRKDAGFPALSSVAAGSAIELPNAAKLAPNTASISDCGPRALSIVCAQLNVPTNLDALRKSAGTTKDGTTMEGLATAAKNLGLKAEGVQVSREGLDRMIAPAVAWDSKGHYLAVLELRGGPGDAGTALIHDPNELSERSVSKEQLLRRSSGYFLLLRQ